MILSEFRNIRVAKIFVYSFNAIPCACADVRVVLPMPLLKSRTYPSTSRIWMADAVADAMCWSKCSVRKANGCKERKHSDGNK